MRDFNLDLTETMIFKGWKRKKEREREKKGKKGKKDDGWRDIVFFALNKSYTL